MNITIHLDVHDESVIHWIEAESQRTGCSIEQVVAQLIKSGIAATHPHGSHNAMQDIDALAGGWSASDAEEFQKNSAPFRQIDTTMWQ